MFRLYETAIIRLHVSEIRKGNHITISALRIEIWGFVLEIPLVILQIFSTGISADLESWFCVILEVKILMFLRVGIFKFRIVTPWLSWRWKFYDFPKILELLNLYFRRPQYILLISFFIFSVFHQKHNYLFLANYKWVQTVPKCGAS
jgi:hypothetical protein